MVVPLFLCLLFGAVWCGPEATYGVFLDQAMTSDISPDESGLSDLKVAGDVTPDQLVVALTGLIQSSVREVTAASHAELTARLYDVQLSLTAISSRLDTLPELAARVDTIEKAVAGMSSLQKGLQQTLTSVSSRQEDVQEDLTAISGRLGNVTESLAALSGRQQDVQKACSAHSSRQDGVTEALTTLSDRQREAQQILGVLPTRQYIQQTLAVHSSRLDSTETLAALSARQQDVQQALSSHSTRLDGLTETLATLTDRQQDVQQALSSRLDGVTETLATLTDRQQDVQQTLSTHSSLLDGVTDVLSTGPHPAGRPGLITGRVLGEPCRGDPDCGDLRADTVCGSRGRCECRDGLQRVAGEVCRPYPRLSDGCRATSDCRGSTEHAVCTDSECSCPIGLSNFNNTECRSGLGIGQACVHDTDCSTILGLTCNAGACAVRTCDTASSSKYRYRLVGGSSCADGYVQFTFNAGQLWQYVCDSNWTEEDATVLCRYMEFSHGTQKPGNNTAVDATNYFSVKDYVCSGSERSLSSCRRTYGRSSCLASEVAAVVCYME